MEVILLKNDLVAKTKENLLFIDKLSAISLSNLNQKPSPKAWSVLECIEHLNRYGSFYQSEIDAIKSISSSKKSHYKSGYFGNKFALSMLPEKGPTKKMKTFSSKKPASEILDVKILETFRIQQTKLLESLENFEFLNLNTKVKTTLRLMKFKLGDTFRFVINHNVRHIQQAERVLQSIC